MTKITNDGEQQTVVPHSSASKTEHQSTLDIKVATSGPHQEDSDIHPKWRNVPPGRAPIKPLPLGWRESESYYAYGWAVTEQMMRDLLTKYKRPVTHQYIFDMVNGMSQLSASAGYPLDGMLLTTAEFDYVEATSSKMIEVDGQPTLIILAIGSTTSKRKYWPSPRQIRRLSKILGDEVRWYKEASTKEDSVFDD